MFSTISIIVYLLAAIIVLYLFLHIIWFVVYHFVVKPIASVTYLGLFVVERFWKGKKFSYNLPEDGRMQRIVVDIVACTFTVLSGLYLYMLLKDPIGASNVVNFMPPSWGYSVLILFALLMLFNKKQTDPEKNWLKKIEETGFIGLVLKCFKNIK